MKKDQDSHSNIVWEDLDERLQIRSIWIFKDERCVGWQAKEKEYLDGEKRKTQ